MDIERLLVDPARRPDASAIQRFFDLGARLRDPINLAIGQPHFPVPDEMKRAACAAIADNKNGYVANQGVIPLRERLAAALRADLGWDVAIDPAPPPAGRPSVMMTSGTSGSLMLAFMAVANPGDEIIVPDPYFAFYPHLARAAGAVPVYCDTYPDFRMTAARVEPLITARTKVVVLNSPSNPSGVVVSNRECAELLDLCRRRGVLLLSDEVYGELTYADACEPPPRPDTASARPRCPSPARFPGAENDVLVVRGFGKTYGVTGWRLGYAAGPSALIREMRQFQQFVYVCAPAPLQWGALAAFDIDMTPIVNEYQRRRDRVLERLRNIAPAVHPGGAFYVFMGLPPVCGVTAQRFVERCIEKNLLVIPGNVVSRRDTHVRISYAASDETLERGLDVIVELLDEPRA